MEQQLENNSPRRRRLDVAVRRKVPSERLFGINWQKILPVPLTEDGVSLHAATFEETDAFTKANLKIFYRTDPANSLFAAYSPNASRETYYRDNSDGFIFKHEGKTVGIVTAQPTDWSTYYYRSGIILPEYQNKRIIQKFLIHTMGVLAQHGVDRAFVEVVPAHSRSIHLYNKLGFFITGVTTSDRWGMLLQFTKFLNDKSRDIYLRQFCVSTD